MASITLPMDGAQPGMCFQDRSQARAGNGFQPSAPDPPRRPPWESAALCGWWEIFNNIFLSLDMKRFEEVPLCELS